ncbi:MAG: VOC family protein [Anaerolineales bacterium]|nr:VOC family protein [Anaerolineales bacterium]
MTNLSPTPFRIHPGTLPGHVHLTVADLERQLTFYQTVIGLQRHWREGDSAGLGVGGADLVRLTEMRGARRYRGTTGMYHFAILLPNRVELARAIGRLFTLRYRNSPTDHIMTKTTYLDDPEGNTIELYTESPEDGVFEFVDGNPIARRADGTPSDGREPLDLNALFALLRPDDRLDQPMPPETRVGHYHLYVANLAETRHFYHGILGFDDMGIAQSFRMGMVSAGRYHHHIGYNTWVGEGAPPAPSDALGLRYFTFNLPNQAELDQVEEHALRAGIPIEPTPEGLQMRDPSNNAIVLTTPK